MPNYSSNYQPTMAPTRYNYSGLPDLVGPTSLPPISPGGTIAIDTNENIRTGAAGYMTDEDKRKALLGYGSSDDFFNGMMRNGGYDQSLVDGYKSNMSSSITGAGNSVASRINSALSQRGLGQNVYAGMQTRQNAAFNANAQVARLDSDIRQKQLENEFAGASGSAGNAGAKAGIYSRPTQESAQGMMHQDIENDPMHPKFDPNRPINFGGGANMDGYNSVPKKKYNYSANYSPTGGGF